MGNINDYFPIIVKNYLGTIKEIDKEVESQFDIKTKELILVGIGTAIGNENVIRLHSQKAIKNGATKDDLRATAIMPLPIVGITNCQKAVEIIDEL